MKKEENLIAKMFASAKADPEKFWAEQAQRIDWLAPWHKVKDCSFHSPVRINWFAGGKLNIAANCLDRHVETQPNKVAIIWEADDPTIPSRFITYSELAKSVQKMANVLLEQGVKKGDFVTIYLPMIPEAAMVDASLAHELAPLIQLYLVGFRQIL